MPYVESLKLIVPAPVIVAVTESSATPAPAAAFLIVTSISASVVASAVATAEIAVSEVLVPLAAPMKAVVCAAEAVSESVDAAAITILTSLMVVVPVVPSALYVFTNLINFATLN